MSSGPTWEIAAAETESSGRSQRLWAVVLVVLLVVGSTVLWLALSSTDGHPTLTFDGTTATYSGPTTLDAGPIAFTLENTSDGSVAFMWVLDSELDAVLENENRAVNPTWPLAREFGVSTEPDPAEGGGQFGKPVERGASIEGTWDLPKGRFALFAWDTQWEGHVAAVIDVIGE